MDGEMEDWLVAAIDNVTVSTEAARQALTLAADSVVEARRRRVEGAPADEVADALFSAGGPPLRRRIADALQRYERSVMVLRSEMVRNLVNEHGLTLTEVATRLSISRQMATRLYCDKDSAVDT